MTEATRQKSIRRSRPSRHTRMPACRRGGGSRRAPRPCTCGHSGGPALGLRSATWSGGPCAPGAWTRCAPSTRGSRALKALDVLDPSTATSLRERVEAGGRTLPLHDPNKRQRVAPPATFLDGVPTLPEQYERRPALEATPHHPAPCRLARHHRRHHRRLRPGGRRQVDDGRLPRARPRGACALSRRRHVAALRPRAHGRRGAGDARRRIGVDPRAGQARAGRGDEARALAGQRRLLVLDDVWTAEQLGAFAALTAEGGLLGRLVTTRNDELAGEHAQKVDPLQGDEELRVLASVHHATAERDGGGAARRRRRAAAGELCSGNPAQLRSVAALCKKKAWRIRGATLEACKAEAAESEAAAAGGVRHALRRARRHARRARRRARAERCTMLAVFPEDAAGAARGGGPAVGHG